MQFTQFSGSSFPNFYNPTLIQDTNGNRITIAYNTSNRITTITDTLGRVVTYNYSGGLLASITQAVTGGTKTWATFTWNQNQPLTYNFTAGGFFVLAPGNTTGSVVQPASGSVINALASCTYANGTGYKFLYGANGAWGVIHTIQNVSASNPQQVRSSISYNFPSGSTSLNDAPAYTQQTVFDGVNNANFTYNVSKNAAGLVTSYAITDPLGTKSTTTLFANGDWKDGLVSSVEIRKADNTLLRTVANDWTADPTTNKNARVCRSTNTLSDTGQQSRIDILYAGELTPCVAAATTNGNVVRQDEYDFGLILKRKTETTFSTATALTTRHILDRPTQIVVKDGAGATIARTDLDYDSTAVAGVSGTINGHDTNFGTAFSARGNLTMIRRYTNAPAASGAIDRFFTYDMLGNLVVADLDCCNKKQFTFTAATQFAYPDSIVRGPTAGPQLTTGATYDFDNGNVLTATDENSKVTTFFHDAMGRMFKVRRPDNVDLITDFDDASRQIIVKQHTPIDATHERLTMTTVDGLNTLQETRDGGNNLISTVKSIRDLLGRVSQVSNPYGPSETPIFTTTTYDALSRPITITPPSQGTQNFEYSGNKVKTTDPAGKQRRHITDALGRLARVDEPGSAGSSTVTISGSTQVIVGSPGTVGTGSVTISGGVASFMDDSDPAQCVPNKQGFIVCPTIYDWGSITVTVAGVSKSTQYGQGTTATGVANNLRNAFVGDPNVIVGGSGTTISFTARQPAGNYALSLTRHTNDPGNFPSGSFVQSSTSGPTLTGGVDPVTPAVDTGTVTLTINGVSKVANYGGASNANSVAADLANQFNNDANSPVIADAAGASIWVVSTVEGSGSNYTLTTASATNQPSRFASPSYTATGSSLSGGGGSPGINNPIFTLYFYDSLDNLTKVVQGTQTRTYNYDSLGRLKDSTTPEAGMVQYTYTSFSAVQTRTDARGVITTYGYDGLNRPQTITYNVGATGVPATSGVTYTYGASAAANNIGRLLSMTDGPGSETYSYNNLGQVTQVAKVISGTTRNIGYGYNPAGELQTLTYPSGRVVTQAFDAIGRLSQISSAGTSYLTVPASNGYNAAGQLLNVNFGNGVAGAYTYNDHLQLDTLKYSQGATELMKLAYKYLAPNGGNNGQIQGVDDNTGGANIPAKSTAYTYDEWSRLSVAQTNNLTAASTWKLGWGYDRYGNRLSQSLLGGTLSVTAPQLGISPTTNRITTAGYAYDANGNLTNDSLHAYTFDAENRTTSVDATAATYTYDGNSLRVKKQVGTTITVYVAAGSKVIAEYVNGSLSKEYVYSGSQLLATIAGSATTYSHPDHLSTRLETNGSGGVSRTFGHLPFGDTWYETGTANKLKFTSYERDTESSLDYAVFRFNSWRLGRFTSPDPIAGNIGNPQSLNRYSYVGNDPINLTDPLGLLTKRCVDETGEPIPCPTPGPGNSGFDASVGSCRFSLDNLCLDFIMNLQLLQADSTESTISARPDSITARESVICDIDDLVWNSLEFKFLAGFEANLGNTAKLGVAMFKNLTTGESGATGSVKAVVLGGEVEVKAPPEVPMNVYTGKPTYTVSSGPLEHNVSTGENDVKISFGFAFGMGGEVSFSGKKFKDLASKCDIITAKNH